MGVKITNEVPKGLRSNLKMTYNMDPIQNETYFESNSKPKIWKKLLYSLSFFHAVVLERRDFGPLGWNIPYGFMESDMRISCEQLHSFLNEFDEIPFQMLHYLTAHCNYGGRVTDDKDRRFIDVLLHDYYNFDILNNPDFTLAPFPAYKSPEPGSLAKYRRHIDKLPHITEPEVYGLHRNANITRNQQETQVLLDALLSC